VKSLISPSQKPGTLVWVFDLFCCDTPITHISASQTLHSVVSEVMVGFRTMQLQSMWPHTQPLYITVANDAKAKNKLKLLRTVTSLYAFHESLLLANHSRILLARRRDSPSERSHNKHFLHGTVVTRCGVSADSTMT
jgi:hypothetical protein